ncbi:enoyl-CoA hydratase/isomerase family protein [Mycobacterium colombiense]|uniref:enoyl-CoA hydratase/isomerase family protein n=1 Tax=Mycobacterium colombiense TaxID=339268 RepID=UPI00200A3C35|nr:enoyl-CoA hydratase/isomerase family protein [Mycobacterium colombiense]MCK8642359.1 enoyl-CoA hydratase/isomerase family protein [Mycobacterium colombiense]
MTFAVSIHEGVATFTLDNPPQNRLSPDVLFGFAAGLEQVKTDETVRVVVVRARGENFSYGGDITFWPQITPEQMGEMLGQALSILEVFETLPVPVIAAVQGDCFGGGFEVALRADVIIATESARFRHPEATLGVITLLGGVQRVAERAGRARAARWALTTEIVSAADALAAGVIAEVVADDALALATTRWTHMLARGATRAHAAHKRLLDAWATSGVQSADKLIPEMATELLRTRDAQRGITSAVEALSKGTDRPDLEFVGR